MDPPSSSRARGWSTAAAALAAVILLHFASWELLPFVFAAVIAFVSEPVVAWLMERTHAPRWIAASGFYIVLAGSVGTLAIFTALAAMKDVGQIASEGVRPLQSALMSVLGPNGVQAFGQRITAETVIERLGAFGHDLAAPATLMKLGRPAAAAAIGLILLAVLTFYMMVSGPSLARGALWLVPPSRREGVKRVLPAMLSVTRRYFLGVLAVVVITAAFAWLGYGLVLHVNGAALLAVAVGLLETVPVVGPITAAALVGLAALQLHDALKIAIMVGYALALRLVIDDLVAPLVLGRSVTVHPVVVMLAYVLGAVLFGVPGLLLAVPAAACTRIWLKDTYERGPTAPD